MPTNHLYIHVPFCARRCVYCDFSIAVRSRVPVDEYLQSLRNEFQRRYRAADLDLDTLYIGGGTPSRLGPAGIRRFMDLVRQHALLRENAEVTLEANPEDVSAEAVRTWSDVGITRVSLGVQSFDDAVLTWMHRTHDANSAKIAIQVLRENGLANLSIDLIFAVPSSVRRSWAHDLQTASELDLPHVSIYGLTVEPHTPLGRWVARNDLWEAPEHTFEHEFLAAHEHFTNSGLEHYEVSNYGKPGRHSRHNWAYWKRAPYGGLGPSAHAFDGRSRRWNAAPYAEWVTRLANHTDPVSGWEELGPEQQTAEEVYLGLRTIAGVGLSRPEESQIVKWVEVGWAILCDEGRLRLTPSGWLRLDALAANLTLFRSR